MKKLTNPVKKKLIRKNPDRKGMYPFLFFLPEDYKAIGTTKVSRNTWIVKIAYFDYTFYNSKWMMDEELGDHVLHPDVDLTKKSHKFYSEKEALEFIRDWWCK